MKAGNSQRQEFICCTGWFKREGIKSEESRIFDGFFEGIEIVYLVSENILEESGISVKKII